jgi:hypothetical protein
MNTRNANELEQLGLMEKWGFHRPLLGWNNETWHVEPYPGKDYGKRNDNNYPMRPAAAMGQSDLKIGGDILNLPQNKIVMKTQPSTIEKLELSDATIEKLAKAMGTSMKGSLSYSKQPQINIDSAMRG